MKLFPEFYQNWAKKKEEKKSCCSGVYTLLMSNNYAFTIPFRQLRLDDGRRTFSVDSAFTFSKGERVIPELRIPDTSSWSN